MKWTIKLVFEVVPGSPVVQEVGTIERREEISPATVGLTIAEGKALLASLQKQIVRMVEESEVLVRRRGRVEGSGWQVCTGRAA